MKRSPKTYAVGATIFGSGILLSYLIYEAFASRFVFVDISTFESLLFHIFIAYIVFGNLIFGVVCFLLLLGLIIDFIFNLRR